MEKVSLAKTNRAGYQVSERFFNVWYLMRYTPRRTRRRLTWLVEFMRLWFSADDLRRQARHSLDRFRGAHAGDWSPDYALALSDALPEDCEERHLLQEVLSLPGKVEDSDRKAIPKNAWYGWFNLGNLLRDLNQSKEAEDAYLQAIELVPKNPYPLANPDRLLVARCDAQEVRVSPLTAKHAEDTLAIDYVHLILQAQLWLGNRDAAGQALERLAAAAATGSNWALFRLQEQARECHAIGRGPALADLLETSPHAELLQPIALALWSAWRRRPAPWPKGP